MGVPMVASAVSTVLTCVPLFFTQLLVLNKFAGVIAVTMFVGLVFAFLFLVPLMAMFGPDHAHVHDEAVREWPKLKQVLYLLSQSKAVRFVACAIILIIFMVRLLSLCELDA